MILDANVLLYAVDASSAHHTPASAWLTSTLNGDSRVGIPVQTIGAFVRIATHPRAMTRPLSAPQAWEFVASWLALRHVWVPPATDQTAAIMGELVTRYQVTGNLVTDAQLAALAIENGVPMISTDTDFARFAELKWVNPLAVSGPR